MVQLKALLAGVALLSGAEAAPCDSLTEGRRRDHSIIYVSTNIVDQTSLLYAVLYGVSQISLSLYIYSAHNIDV